MKHGGSDQQQAVMSFNAWNLKSKVSDAGNGKKFSEGRQIIGQSRFIWCQPLIVVKEKS